MRYFTYTSRSIQPKNRLQEACINMINEHSHLIIDGSAAVAELIETIKRKVEELNKEHSRCKAESVEYYSNGFRSDPCQSIYISDCVSLKIYQAKN